MYDLYYYIPWPDSQKYQDKDPENFCTFPSDDGAVFAEKQWVDCMITP